MFFSVENATMSTYMKKIRCTIVATFSLLLGFLSSHSANAQGEVETGGETGIIIKLSGAFDKPGNYLVNRGSVHIQDIISKTGTILLARKDVALVVKNGEASVVKLDTKSDSTLLHGGEEVYLYERIINPRKR